MAVDSTIETLARSFGPVRPARLHGAPIILGALVAAVAVTLFWGVRPGAFTALDTPAPWMKCGYTAALAAAALYLATSLGKPGADFRRALLAVCVPVSVMAIAAAVVLSTLNPEQWLPSMLGRTSSTCSLSILGLSLLTTPLVMFAARELAPVRRQAAGAAVGIAGGAIAATAYGLLYCAEASPAFIAIWYTLGIAGSGLMGAMAGRLWLRW